MAITVAALSHVVMCSVLLSPVASGTALSDDADADVDDDVCGGAADDADDDACTVLSEDTEDEDDVCGGDADDDGASDTLFRICLLYTSDAADE